MKTKIILIISFFLIIILAIKFNSANNKLKNINTYNEYLFKLEIINSKINHIIFDLNNYSYDELSKELKEFKTKLEKIKKIDINTKEIKESLNTIELFYNLKADIIETLKSNNAVLNNSKKNSITLYKMFRKKLSQKENTLLQDGVFEKMILSKDEDFLENENVLSFLKNKKDLENEITVDLFLSNINVYKKQINKYNLLYKEIKRIKLKQYITNSIVLGKNSFLQINNQIKTIITIFVLMLILILIYLFFTNIKLNTYSLKIKKQKLKLEDFSLHLQEKVEKQTEVINKQLLIEKEQSSKLVSLNENLEDVNKTLEQNITYAALIQNNILPEQEILSDFFKESFIIWQPKDIVGGDIYLFENFSSKDECLVMVIDCTGHGVYGAFLTMLVKAVERQIIEIIQTQKKEIDTAEILNIFNETLQKILSKESTNKIQAGFDGQVLYYNKKTKEVKVASANNDIYYFEDKELKTIKATRKSVGYSKRVNSKKVFTQSTIQIKDDTRIYLSTDGYFDQFQEDGQKQFGKKRFYELLNNIYNKPFKEQKDILEKELKNFMGKQAAIDDISVLGLKF